MGTELRITTDPTEGPKAFILETRQNSRGELAVILMGVDTAERYMLSESVAFQIGEDEFVAKVRVPRALAPSSVKRFNVPSSLTG